MTTRVPDLIVLHERRRAFFFEPFLAGAFLLVALAGVFVLRLAGVFAALPTFIGFGRACRG